MKGQIETFERLIHKMAKIILNIFCLHNFQTTEFLLQSKIF